MIAELLDRLRRYYRNSQALRLMLIFFLFFVVTGTLVSLIERHSNDQFKTIPDGWWWAIITFSTTGYGDKVPVTLAGRLITVITIFVGIAAMSVLTATFASFFVDQNSRARRGLVELKHLQHHLIVCGWKEDMQEVLLAIVHGVPSLSSHHLVLVSNAEGEQVEHLRGSAELEDLRFVRGDYFSEHTLRRANVHGASKVIVLADTLESSSGSEADSRTVITVLTVKSMAREVYVIAELLDRKYANYLKQANCDEIIFTNDLKRSILANATRTNGMSYIVGEMMGGDDQTACLTTIDIGPEFYGGTYASLRAHVQERPGCVLIGLLENTGSPHAVKLEALREAQKTSDVSMLLHNLQSVKGLAVNTPVLIPGDEYAVQRHSRAIVLERR